MLKRHVTNMFIMLETMKPQLIEIRKNIYICKSQHAW